MYISLNALLLLAIASETVLTEVIYPKITVFNEINYSGFNRTVEIKPDICYALGPGPNFNGEGNKKLRSIKIRRPLQCQFYPRFNCQGNTINNVKYPYGDYPDFKPGNGAKSYKCPPRPIPALPPAEAQNTVTLYPQEGYKGPITGIQIFYPQLSNARECLVLRGSLQNKVMSARFGNNLNCFGYQTKDCSEGPLNGLGTPLYPGFLLRLDYPNTKEGRGGEDLEKLQSFECNR